jgi:hypothetical protein
MLLLHLRLTDISYRYIVDFKRMYITKVLILEEFFFISIISLALFPPKSKLYPFIYSQKCVYVMRLLKMFLLPKLLH